MKKLSRYIPLATLVATVVLCACSAKKNTAGSRFWQAFTTRYNVYYNGITHYNEQIKILENDYEDDYSQRLFVHPAEAYSNPKSPQPSTNFARTIEKMQKAISLHSIKKKPKKKSGKGNDTKYKEWLKRDEYNPFIHNAWYTLGRAEYMKGDFLSSAATFHYIARHFTWKPDLVTESQVWEVLSYCAMGWTTEADNVLAHIHLDKIEDKRVLALANLAYANYYIKDKKSQQAIPYLAAAVKGFGGGEKVRLYFLLGQLYEEAGQKELAYQSFKRAGSHSGSTYRTKFNARIKQSAVFQGNDIKSEVGSLKRLTRYDRNKEYLDQIYYAIGNLYLSRKDTVKAVDNYKLAAEKSTRNGIDKAISQLTLGGIYFNQHKYDLAQPCYAEAVPQLNEDYPNYKAIKKRSDVLDELAVYAQNVTLQDSLLRLSKMSLDEQKKVIKKIIDELKKKEKEEAENAKREEYLAQQDAQGDRLKGGNTSSSAPQSFMINNDKSWYFYNTATKNAGKTAFQKQWGNRKLEDNWRRRNKNTFSLGNDNPDAGAAAGVNDTIAGGAPGDTTKQDKQALQRAEDPHYEEYYLKQIPKTPEEIQTAHDVIQEGLYNMGLILKDKLEDYSAAEFQFNELLRRYPDNIYRLDTYYNIYLMCMRGGRTAQAEDYRQRILTEFADSKYGMAMKDPNYLDNLKNMGRVQEEMYAQAYQDYLNNNNQAVHEAYAEMMRTYPLSKLMPKFMFIDALAYVTQRNYDKFKSTLKEMLERYPETDITPTASSIVKQVNQGRKINGGGSNARGMMWTSMRLGNDSTAVSDSTQLKPFKEGIDKPQVFILVYNVDSVNAKMLLYEVARHNFKSFKVRDYDLEQMNFGTMGLLIVKGFPNYNELVNYRTVFDADKEMILPPGTHQVLISAENFDLLLSQGRSFEDYFRYLEEQNTQKVEGKVPETAIDDATLEQAKPAKAGKSVKGKATPRKQHELSELDKAKMEAQVQALKEQLEAKQKAHEDSIKNALIPTVVPENPDLVIDDGTLPVVEEKGTQPVQPVKKKAPVAAPDTTQELEKEQVPVVQEAIQSIEQEVQDKPVRELHKTKPDDAKQQQLDEKARQKAEKEQQKAAEKAEKERQERLKQEQKAQGDSVKNAEKARVDSLKQAEKAREDSVKNAQKQREQAEKQAQKDKVDAQKQKEKERKDKIKAREEAQKQKAQERKERQKQREAERKAYQKQKEQERKAKQKAAEKRRKEKEREAKEKAEQRKASRKN